jgi:hypothetical protein
VLPSLGEFVVCRYDYEGTATHLSFKKGDVIVVTPCSCVDVDRLDMCFWGGMA